jgi:MFS family permease
MTPLAAASSLVFSARGALSLLIQLYLRDLHASLLVISFATSAEWLGVIAGGPLWGTLSCRQPRRFLLFLILGTSAAAIGVLVLLPPVSGVLPSVFVRTFAVAGLTPIAMVIVAQTGFAHRRGRNLSIISCSRTLGVMVGGAVAGFLLGTCGFRWSFLVPAALLLLALPWLLFLPRKKRTAVAESRARARGRWSASGELKSLYLGVAFRQAAISGAASLVFVFMASLEITPVVMGLVKALGLSVFSVGVLGFGWLADRMKRRPIFLFGFGMAGLSPLAFAFASSAWGMVAGYLLLGMSFGSYHAARRPTSPRSPLRRTKERYLAFSKRVAGLEEFWDRLSRALLRRSSAIAGCSWSCRGSLPWAFCSCSPAEMPSRHNAMDCVGGDRLDWILKRRGPFCARAGWLRSSMCGTRSWTGGTHGSAS